MQSTDSQEVVKRFFEALNMLKTTKKIRGKQTFANAYGINRRNLWSLEKNSQSDRFQTAWLTYLVRDFNVSATWLLTGKGEILNK